METIDRNHHGAFESNGLVDGAGYHASTDYSFTYDLAGVKAAGGRITRVRLLTERCGGQLLADVSYIHATLPDGTVVPVQSEIGHLTPYHRLKGEFIRWAKAQGVYAKGIGLLDEANWSTL